MAIITISRGSFSHGKEIAEKVAAKLGYECISREVLIEASEFFHVPEMKLTKSIHDAPGILERMMHGKEQYISYIRAALLQHVKNDNVVYHGHAGHLLVPEFPNVLKVRILAELEDRIALLQKREKMSREKALAYIEKEDKQRAMWTKYLYNVDISDPKLYDLMIHLQRLTVNDAVDIICTAATSPSYQLTPKQKKEIQDLAISSHAKAKLRPICEAEVRAHGSVLYIKAKPAKIKKTGYSTPKMGVHLQDKITDDLTKQILNAVASIPGVKDVECDIELPSYS